MNYLDKEKLIRQHYSIHHKQRIWGLDDDTCEFKMLLGECIITLPYPKMLARDKKLKELLK